MNLSEKKKFIINFTYYLLWFTFIYILFKISAIYLLPIFISVIIAIVVQKPAICLSKKINIKKDICAAVLSALIYISSILVLSLIVWFLYMQIEKTIKSVSNSDHYVNLIESLFGYFTKFLQGFTNEGDSALLKFAQEAENSIIHKVGDLLSDIIANVIKSVPSLLISGIITIVLTCYFAKDYDKLIKFFKGFISEKFLFKINDVKNILFDCVLRFALGYFWLFLITFFQLLIGLFILQVSNFLLLAVLISFIDLLPVLGTGVVLLPWSIIEIINKNYYLGIGLIILYVIIMVIRNFIEPKIIGKQTGISPLFMLIFIFLGLKIGGIMGMVLIPISFIVVFNYLKKQMKSSK